MEYDVVIKNGKIIDGTGNPGFFADIALKDEKIVKIGFKLSNSSSKKVIDANNLIVCPGFIDIHSHSDYTIPFDQMTVSTIHQGITTMVVGMCGVALAPINPNKKELFDKEFSMSAPPGLDYTITWSSFSEYMIEMEKLGCTSNIAHLMGFGMVRLAAMGYENREPSTDELEQMKDYIRDGMKAGAFGLSTGLIYTPQTYAKTEEVIELAKIVAEYNGLYFSHIRNEGKYVVEAVQEVIDIVKKSGCRGGQIAHHKISGKDYWGLSKKTLQIIEEANLKGINITCDQYPYNRGMTSLVTLLPPWSHEGGFEKLLERLNDPEEKEKIRKDRYEGINFESFTRGSGWDNIFIASLETEKWKSFVGKSLTEIAQELNKEDTFDVLCEILIDEKAKGSRTIQSMGDEDIERIMIDRYTMVGTDASTIPLTGPLSHGKPHPRYFGTYPRILGLYVREKKLMPLETAIRKMTSFPAQRLGIFDRGIIREGNWADIVVFNPDTVIDKATFLDPIQLPEGIEHVIVNGELVVEKGNHQLIKPGKILRKKNS